MKLWLRRITMITLSILTLGAYVPEDEEGKKEKKDSEQPDEVKYDTSSAFDSVSDSTIMEEESLYLTTEEQLEDLTSQAKEQMYSKLGPKILNKVEDNILEEIIPKMEDVISSIYDEDEMPVKLSISEHPSSGYGEKIFHIYDEEAETDVIRFHVRRDMKPKQGYYFNFHYHMKEDDFEEHHTIADVYWDKNTPPKWMSH
ncbi:YpjP family protein [Alkalicoccus luteus]|uniref:YpjP-like protein n=1 Tax=Alkalicoccus luteus TaxID=1237094 RepID=A0A969PRK7_9BACI|nr:YpjP family protein [Alkalicoccus luteus]NJP38083.1 hypothetical protein [Alkalicoccus luteus]